MKAVDVCVIGGGVIGLLTARELVMAGCSVTVLEAGDCGKESSWAGGGIVSPLYPWRYRPAVTALASYAQSAYPLLAEQLHRDTGIDPEWQRSGLVLLSIADKADAIDWAHQQARTLLRWRREELAQDQPDLTDDVEDAICFPDVAQIRNPRLLKALLSDVTSRGVSVRTFTPVQGFRRTETGAIAAALTAQGEVVAQQFVVCTGAWSQQILQTEAEHLPIAPVRGQMLMFAPHPHRLHRIVLRDGRYLIPRRDGRILCGSTLEHVGFDKSTTDDAYQSLWQSAVQIMPSLAQVSVAQHWAGLRPGSPAGIPRIGRVPQRENLWLNAGHFRNGIVLAPASARLLADLLLARTAQIDPAPYQWQESC